MYIFEHIYVLKDEPKYTSGKKSVYFYPMNILSITQHCKVVTCYHNNATRRNLSSNNVDQHAEM